MKIQVAVLWIMTSAIQAVHPSDTLVFYITTQCHNSEDHDSYRLCVSTSCTGHIEHTPLLTSPLLPKS